MSRKIFCAASVFSASVFLLSAVSFAQTFVWSRNVPQTVDALSSVTVTAQDDNDGDQDLDPDPTDDYAASQATKNVTAAVPGGGGAGANAPGGNGSNGADGGGQNGANGQAGQGTVGGEGGTAGAEPAGPAPTAVVPEAAAERAALANCWRTSKAASSKARSRSAPTSGTAPL